MAAAEDVDMSDGELVDSDEDKVLPGKKCSPLKAAGNQYKLFSHPQLPVVPPYDIGIDYEQDFQAYLEQHQNEQRALHTSENSAVSEVCI